MCKGYAAAQEAYDRQEPPEPKGPAWECPICGALLFRDDKLCKNQNNKIAGCCNCLTGYTAEEYFGEG